MTVFDIEKKSILQSRSSVWFHLRRNCITSSNTNKILICKKFCLFSWWVFEARNGEEVARHSEEWRKSFREPEDALKHAKLHEPTVRKNYTQYIKFVLKHDINVRETGLVIQPNLFWLAASPNGLVYDHSDSRKGGLIEIKCQN